MTCPRFYANLPRLPRYRPSDGPPVAGILADPATPKSIIGVAFPTTRLGSPRLSNDGSSSFALPEVVWRLEIDREWKDGRTHPLQSKEALAGRFVLRDGEFCELAEEAD